MQVFHLHPNVTFFSFTTPFLDFGLGQLGHLFPTFLLLNSGFCFVYPAFCLCTSNFLIFQKCLLFILLPFMLFTHSFCFFFLHIFVHSCESRGALCPLWLSCKCYDGTSTSGGDWCGC